MEYKWSSGSWCRELRWNITKKQLEKELLPRFQILDWPTQLYVVIALVFNLCKKYFCIFKSKFNVVLCKPEDNLLGKVEQNKWKLLEWTPYFFKYQFVLLILTNIKSEHLSTCDTLTCWFVLGNMVYGSSSAIHSFVETYICIFCAGLLRFRVSTSKSMVM